MLPEKEAVIVLADSGGDILLAGLVIYALVIQDGENLFDILGSQFLVCRHAFTEFCPGFSSNGYVDFFFCYVEIGEDGGREFFCPAAAKFLVKCFGAFGRSVDRDINGLDILRADGFNGLCQRVQGFLVIEEGVKELALVTGEVESETLLRVCVRAE